MQQLNEPRARPRIRRALTIAAALLCATALGQPNLAYAGPHGGGGGGGFHGGGGGGSTAAEWAVFTAADFVVSMVAGFMHFTMAGFMHFTMAGSTEA